MTKCIYCGKPLAKSPVIVLDNGLPSGHAHFRCNLDRHKELRVEERRTAERAQNLSVRNHWVKDGSIGG